LSITSSMTWLLLRLASTAIEPFGLAAMTLRIASGHAVEVPNP
jgi:hypothetical protein